MAPASLAARGLPATAGAITRTVRLTRLGRKYVQMMKRRNALRRAAQAAGS